MIAKSSPSMSGTTAQFKVVTGNSRIPVRTVLEARNRKPNSNWLKQKKFVEPANRKSTGRLPPVGQ